MKKLLFFLYCLLCLISLQAQDLYITTPYSGSYGNGSISKLNLATLALSSVYTFYEPNGTSPNGSLCLAFNGLLYGMTKQGGSNGSGVIYSFAPTNNTYTKLHDFGGTGGATPFGAMLQASNGTLYGLTTYGGSSNAGVIFSFDPSSNTYTKLHDFGGSNGAVTYGAMVQASNGKLYGTTYAGGSYDKGVIFSFDPTNNAFTKLHDFNISDGANPRVSLTKGNDGMLYGMTEEGGSSGIGVIFSFDPTNNAYTKLFDFTGSNGSRPNGHPVQASNGKLYGLTYFGGSYNYGVAFTFDLTNNTYTKLQDFNSADYGAYPKGSLMQASDGKLYGATQNGGSMGYGAVISINPSNNSLTKLADFDGSNGSNPYWNEFLEVCANPVIWYRDVDGDGFGDANNRMQTCSNTAPDGYVASSGDCDDNNGTVHAQQTYYADNDGDGYGDANKSMEACSNTAPDGYVDNSGDCDDNDATTHPGAPELYDGKDNNCNSTTDEGVLPPKLRIIDVAVKEGNSGTKTMTFNVTLSKIPLLPVTVDYATGNKTAKAPGDYLAAAGTLTFPVGERKQTIAITIKGDRVKEPDETFRIVLSNPTNASIGDGVGIGTILNDDGSSTGRLAESPVAMLRSVTLSPNPASSLVTLRLDGFTGKTVIRLMDLQGKVLQEHKLQAGNSKGSVQQQQLTVATLAAGTYLLTIQDQQGNRDTKKLVVTH